MNNNYLLVGPDREKVDTGDIPFSISYSLKDVKNYGKRNTSYTKTISVKQTSNTRRVFKALFNINSVGGYDVGKKVYAELIENGLTILKGSLQVIKITLDTYEVVLSSNNVNILNDLGDKLISGNLNSSNDISWPGTPFQHTWSRDKIREMCSVEPSADGTGYCYPLIDWSGDIEWPNGFILNQLYPNTLIDDYRILPSIAAKQIFDRIFEVNGYTYEMSSDIESVFEKMYIPFNDDWQSYTADSWEYSKYYLGNPTYWTYSNTSVLLSSTSITATPV